MMKPGRSLGRSTHETMTDLVTEENIVPHLEIPAIVKIIARKAAHCDTIFYEHIRAVAGVDKWRRISRRPTIVQATPERQGVTISGDHATTWFREGIPKIGKTDAIDDDMIFAVKHKAQRQQFVAAVQEYFFAGRGFDGQRFVGVTGNADPNFFTVGSAVNQDGVAGFGVQYRMADIAPGGFPRKTGCLIVAINGDVPGHRLIDGGGGKTAGNLEWTVSAGRGGGETHCRSKSGFELIFVLSVRFQPGQAVGVEVFRAR
ncbi:hypothetical protein SDC9_149623 [bioreactor metagenome]|uniref:Uncharacterized protein n=1 Tax=bioreactor metagenome TaxID=1076179 RepID=A0A645EKV2_9ZZZZ